MTPDKYKDEAKRQASNAAPSRKLEVFNTLTAVGLTKANYEDKMNNPEGKDWGAKVKVLTDYRTKVLDAFNIGKDAKVRSDLSAHSQAKKNARLNDKKEKRKIQK